MNFQMSFSGGAMMMMTLEVEDNCAATKILGLAL
jgi:hypothetical protein